MRPSPKQTNTGLNLFTAVEEPTVVSPRFWVHLVQYRPLILLGGLWLGFVCVAAVAYSRLMFAGVPLESRQPPPPTTSRTEVLKGPSLEGEPLSTPVPTPSDPAAPESSQPDLPLTVEDPLVVVPEKTSSTTVPAWSLGLLVSLCAVGCFLMARQATAEPRPRKVQAEGAGSKKPSKKGRRPNTLSGHPGKPIASRKLAGTASGPKRLQPYSPERDQAVVPMRPADVQLAESSPTPVRPKVIVMPPENAVSAPEAEKVVPPKVTVLSEGEAHSLDWPDGSLAHSLDIRQRRSLSSFL